MLSDLNTTATGSTQAMSNLALPQINSTCASISTQESLTIGSLNMRGALQLKWPHIKKFFKKHHLDVLLLQETKATTQEWAYTASHRWNVLSPQWVIKEEWPSSLKPLSKHH
jgi:hypothetical protein